jgi:hypothetical protein
MTLQIYIDSLDQIPDNLKDHYKQHGDGYLLDAATGGGFSVENVAGLKSALSAARAEAKAATSKVAAFVGDDGEMLDATVARAAMDRLESLGSDSDVEAKVTAAVQAQVDAINKQHGKELAGASDQVAGLRKQLTKHVLDDALLNALTDTSDGRTPAVNAKVLSAALRNDLKVAESEGQWEVHVLDGDGNRRISPASGSQDWMTVREMVDEGRNGDLKPFFKANQVLGTGGIDGHTSHSGASPMVSATSNQSPTERLKAYYENQGM